MAQVFNFSSGPAMLPADVLKLAQQELCDWNGLGTSVMEVSHRGKEFIQVAEEAESRGIKKKTLWNAKKELEIESVKIGNQWFWMLPE